MAERYLMPLFKGNGMFKERTLRDIMKIEVNQFALMTERPVTKPIFALRPQAERFACSRFHGRESLRYKNVRIFESR